MGVDILLEPLIAAIESANDRFAENEGVRSESFLVSTF